MSMVDLKKKKFGFKGRESVCDNYRVGVTRATGFCMMFLYSNNFSRNSKNRKNLEANQYFTVAEHISACLHIKPEEIQS